MTVIAWDSRYVVADGQETSGCLRTAKPVKKIEVRNGVVYAVSGLASLHKPLIDWVHDHGADPEKRPFAHDEHQNTCVVVFREGKCYTYDLKSPYPTECFAPDAWGCSTAAHYVIGAMESGADAKTAVERAIIRNTCIGGPVQVIDLESLKAKAIDPPFPTDPDRIVHPGEAIPECDHEWSVEWSHDDRRNEKRCRKCGYRYSRAS